MTAAKVTITSVESWLHFVEVEADGELVARKVCATKAEAEHVAAALARVAP